jgi:hypothetical protein
MPSTARHLLFPVENTNKKQIPRWSLNRTVQRLLWPPRRDSLMTEAHET